MEFMEKIDWLGKPYYSLNSYFKHTYGEKVYKIAVDAGLSCPNRDGTLDSRGCIFCSAGGSGDFAYDLKNNMDEKIACMRDAAGFNKQVGRLYVIYFQAYTNTYGDLEYLKELWSKALENDDVVGISIATRPDCLGLGNEAWKEPYKGVLDVLSELKKKYEPLGKFIWVELGLQTIHEKTAEYIRRHYTLDMYEEAVKALADRGIPYITHIILGLPGETEKKMLETVKYVCNLPYKVFGIKLQLLHVLENTDLKADYEKCPNDFILMNQDKYLNLVVECLRWIPSDVVIHRVTGDGPKCLLVAPKWSTNKKVVLNTLHKIMRENGAIQGEYADDIMH